jgi:hypothetical protein
MHIITGLVLAGLAGMKKNRKKVPMPGFTTGPVRTVHALPGRIRFRVPSLIDNRKGKEIIEGRFSGLAGITSVAVSEVTGSVLIYFTESEVRPELIFAAIVKLLGLEAEVENPPPPLVAKELKLLGESLNRAVYEKTGGMINLWTALMVALAALGVRRVITDGSRAWPAGFTLLWWAINAMKRQE